MGSVYARLGAKVTVVEYLDAITPGMDAEVAKALQKILRKQGLDFVLGAAVQGAEVTGNGAVLRYKRRKDGAEAAIEADAVLVATGRRPFTAGLGLDALGVKVGPRGEIPVDEYNRTSCPTIHAVGDVTDRVQLTPVAIREGHALADRLFGTRQWRVDHECVPSAVFSHPPLASVGLTEADARNMLGDVRIYTSDFRPMKNVLAGRDERCLYKLVVDGATDRLVGAHMIGPDSPEILQALAIAVKAGLTKAQLDETVALHPSMAEELVLMR
jgi:glutathione reductase (NADPH)